MGGEPEGVTKRPTLVTAPNVMHHPVKGVKLTLKIEQVFTKHLAHFFFSGTSGVADPVRAGLLIQVSCRENRGLRPLSSVDDEHLMPVMAIGCE